ncbi:hypothetical protein Pyn_36627 [Prunus yedoensis var. nudiflora]|uniref:Uncharacterized protein n=1 Tax=Prunus yedoensis var. nudiflora TaxID=2094558 RepID=A0A314Z2U0_PRUYE|nr:hypothetical protein Pyn_36627 [Prunus yedoensis var. nudiflora]
MDETTPTSCLPQPPSKCLNRAGRKRPPSARITRRDHATTTNLVQTAQQPLTTNTLLSVNQSLSHDGDISAAAPPDTRVSAAPPDTTESTISSHLNARNLNCLLQRTLVSHRTEEMSHQLLPAGFPSTNIYERAVILALTHRGWTPLKDQAQSSKR